MTQKPTERLGSSGQYTWLWMVASVIVVAAFMFWLAATSEPSGPQVVEATDEGSELNTPGVVTVTVDELVAGLGSYAGTDVRLEGIQVASRLGAQAFWTTTSSGVPFLVRLTPALVADSFAVAGGESLTLIGRVALMSDSVLDAWREQGVLTDDNQRMEAEFTTGFIEAARAVKVAAAPAAEPEQP